MIKTRHSAVLEVFYLITGGTPQTNAMQSLVKDMKRLNAFTEVQKSNMDFSTNVAQVSLEGKGFFFTHTTCLVSFLPDPARKRSAASL